MWLLQEQPASHLYCISCTLLSMLENIPTAVGSSLSASGNQYGCWLAHKLSLVGGHFSQWRVSKSQIRRTDAHSSPQGFTVVLTESNPVVLEGYGFDFARRKEDVICRFYLDDIKGTIKGKQGFCSLSRVSLSLPTVLLDTGVRSSVFK